MVTFTMIYTMKKNLFIHLFYIQRHIFSIIILVFNFFCTLKSGSRFQISLVKRMKISTVTYIFVGFQDQWFVFVPYLWLQTVSKLTKNWSNIKKKASLICNKLTKSHVCVSELHKVQSLAIIISLGGGIAILYAFNILIIDRLWFS